MLSASSDNSCSPRRYVWMCMCVSKSQAVSPGWQPCRTGQSIWRQQTAIGTARESLTFHQPPWTCPDNPWTPGPALRARGAQEEPHLRHVWQERADQQAATTPGLTAPPAVSLSI